MKFLRRIFHREKPCRPCSVVIAAAGSSRRMEGVNKLFFPLGGIPVLARTLRAFEAAESVEDIVVAAREEDMIPISDICRDYGITKPVKVVRGGNCRLESVLAAAMECSSGTKYIAVHDGARPLVETELIERVIALAKKTNAAAPAVPVKDTIKVVRENVVVSTPDRSTLRCIQTPQVFDRDILLAALHSAQSLGAEITDDCSAVERLGKEIYLTDGSYENMKITTQEDIAFAEACLRLREELR